MPDDQNAQNQPQSEPTFDITITNGAAKRLQGLMEHFNFETAKETVGLALELLESVKDSSSIIVRQKDGSAKQLTLPTPHEPKKE